MTRKQVYFAIFIQKSAAAALLLTLVLAVFSLSAIFIPRNANAQSQPDKLAEIAWVQQKGAAFDIYYASYGQGKWSPAVKINNREGLNLVPSLASAKEAGTWVVWPVALNDTEIKLLYAQVDSENRVSAPAEIATGMRSNTAPFMAVDSTGTPWVVWSGNNGSQDEIYYSVWNGRWSMPVQVNEANEVPDILPEITMDSSDGVTVTWKTFQDDEYKDISKTIRSPQLNGLRRLKKQPCSMSLPEAPEKLDRASLLLNCEDEKLGHGQIRFLGKKLKRLQK